MKKIIYLLLLIGLSACSTTKDSSAKHNKSNLLTVENDPTDTQIYTLKNGLKVYLSVNRDQPRIQTYIAVKAGSKYDPKETTGLAHYLEHMMFKGTHTIGTKDWEKEKTILEEIAKKFEEHKNEKNLERKKEIYKDIDQLSFQASKFAIANEYDKMISSLGAKGTNAYTSFDRTVYVNDIASNELEKFLKIEGERFQTLVLRLFHTELETVYEEFNRSQDNDNRWVFQNVLKGLFPNHPYGNQTTIGEGEHLKNPSLYNIQNYYNTYYRPNNVAICMSGDIDIKKTIDLIEKNFGKWEKKKIPTFKEIPSVNIIKPEIKESFGPQKEIVYLGFKFQGAGSKEAMMMQIIDMMLANSSAGLIDLNLKLGQKVLSAGSYPLLLKDHSAHLLYGTPKNGQSLEDVKNLLLGELENIKNGIFDSWLVEACIDNLKLNRIRQIAKNKGRANLMVDAFIQDIDWEDYIAEHEEMEKISNEDIIKFAKENYNQNYVVSYKRKGEANTHSVPKPEITQLELDRESKSAFFKEFEQIETKTIKPDFVDYEKSISTLEVNDIPFSYIKNEKNELFSLSYIFDMGSDHNKEMALAISYLPYLGTKNKSAEQIKKDFYRLGLSFSVNTSREQVYITLSGLEKNLEQGLELFENLLFSVSPNDKAYEDLVSRILKGREDAKLNKNTIIRSGLINYAKYGSANPFRDKLNETQLRETDPETLVELIKSLTSYPHRIFYHGQSDMDKVIYSLQYYHNPTIAYEIPDKKVYKENKFEESQIFFVPYDMQQVELYLLTPEKKFDVDVLATSQVFNEYFGAGLSSIIYQEIREKKALAYSAYSWYANARKKEDYNYLYAYLGTQHDKLEDAISSLFEVLNDMPEASLQFEAAKSAVIKKMQSSRTIGTSIYWKYEQDKKRGLSQNVNKEVYSQLQKITLDDLKEFFDQHIKGKIFHMCIIGNEEKMDKEFLKTIGNLNHLELSEVFGY